MIKQLIHLSLPILIIVLLFNNLDAIGQENIARGKKLKVFSSNELNGWSADKLTDGEKGGIGWSSKAFSKYAEHTLYPEYAVIDLGETYELEKISLFPRQDNGMAGKGFPENFTIQICEEGEPWKVQVEKKSYPVPANGNEQVFNLNNSKGRYLKIEATRLHLADSGKFCFQLAEVEVFGKECKVEPLKSIQISEKRENAILHLRCENEENPIGIDMNNPRFSWWLSSLERGILQANYQILVSSNQTNLTNNEGDMWNSGVISGCKSTDISYKGKPLKSGKQYWWKVKAMSTGKKVFGWSEPAYFATGKLNQDDWKGKWIGADADSKHAAVYLRKEIEIQKPVKRAMVFFSGLGFSELHIEGKKIGADFVAPGFTTYNKLTQYVVYDVTKELSGRGWKGLGVTLVDGWYGQGHGHGFEKNSYVDSPKLLFNLVVEYADGTETTIVSDENWKWSFGEITFSHILREDIDLRKLNPGWDKAGYAGNSWKPVKLVRAPGGNLVRQKEPPCRIIEEIHPVSMTYDAAKNSCSFDFGREVAGTVHLRTKGKSGTVITITPISSAPETAIINPNSSSSCKFILAGSGDAEVYNPRFYNIAINKVEISGLEQVPELEDVTASILSSGWERTGKFSCSDGLINSLEDIVRRTSAYYTTFLPNDPTREWKAWTQDITTMFVSNTYLFDSQRMYERWQRDMMNDQRDDGNVPNVCPGAYFDDYNSPWWGGCVVWSPWNLYQYYGNLSFLKDSYPAMKRYVDFLTSSTKDGLQDWGLSDWCPIEETPRRMINTPAYYYYATIISKTAALLDKKEDEKVYSDLARSIKQSFNDTFLDTQTGIYRESGWKVTSGYPLSAVGGIVPHKIWWKGEKVPTQAGQILPLALGLVPGKMIPLVQKALLSEIESHNMHLSTGFCSTTYLLKYLEDFSPETAWNMVSKQDYPSWYSNTIGSDNSLMKEMWHGGQVFMPSLAGNIGGWIYESLGGIRPGAPGFSKIVIKPTVVDDLHWVNSSYNSAYGAIVSNWKRRGKEFQFEITIPANTTATIYLPAAQKESVKENNRPVSSNQHVQFLRMENGNAVMHVGSGRYLFTSLVK